MIVLALDTSTSACSAALWQDGAILASRLRSMARGQSEALVPMVAEIMAEGGWEFSRVDLLAVTVGPGAFTGLRIGLATARGLALARDLPLAGVSTTLAVAAAIPAADRCPHGILAAIESRRDEVWLQAFAADLTPLSEVVALTPERAGELISGTVTLVGDAAGRVLPHLPAARMAAQPGWPDAGVVAALAAAQWAAGTALPPEPLYLRPPDVTVSG